MRLVLATRNDHKVRELARLLPGVELEPLPPGVTLPPEDGDTFAANALGKARAAAAALGRPAIGDDSGVEAEALGGAPGIHSARFAGPDATDGDNLAKLRAEAPAGSGLRYVCVMAYAEPGGAEATFTGTCEGTLAAEARGSGGFGYDPAFLPADRGRRPHDGRAQRRGEGRDLAPRPRDPRAGGVARRGRERHGVSAPTLTADDLADARGRRRSAGFSVIAACFLVALKFGTGLATGSLAFLAEAAHSATDLVAALLTLFAIRVATRPPDPEHNYGHGKAEHLAALGESAVLLLFALAIGAESISRLAEGGGHGVEATWWSFLVLAVVITIDVTRMVASRRAARRHGSPALAANALHFGSDLAGSLAVLAGTILVAAGTPSADAVAALLVAVLVIGLALRLAWQSVEVLMDRTSGEAEQRIRAALAGMREPLELRRVRVRHAAGRHFADIVVGVAPDKGVGQAHATADAIEDLVADALGTADVVVHVEPAASTTHGGLRELATAAALTIPEVREVHNVRVMRVGEAYELSLHVKLPRELSLAEAHDVIERLEEGIHAAVPALGHVHTHIEPLSRTDWAYTPAAADTALEREAVEEAVRGITGAPPAEIRFRDAERGRVALVTITLPGEQPLPSAHHHAGRIEEAVRERCPAIADVIVHTEPDPGGRRGGLSAG